MSLAEEIWDLLVKLRANGASVTILPDQPEQGYPCAAVECCGSWTGWRNQRFCGDNVLEALEKAWHLHQS